MTGLGFLDLPQPQRQEIVDHVRGCIATFGGPTLDSDQIHDLVRWAIDGYRRSSLVEIAFDEGFEAGRQQGFTDAMARIEADQKAASGG